MDKVYNELKKLFISYYFNVLSEDIDEDYFINRGDVQGLIFGSLIE